MRVQVDGTSEAREGRLAYSDALLREIGERLSESWRVLGGRLKITAARMDALVARGDKSPEELCAEMFKTWWSKSTRNARWGERCVAFSRSKRMDLLYQTLSHFHKNRLDYRTPDPRTMEKYFIAISKFLASRWKEVGGYLHLAPERIDRIAEESRGNTAEWAFQVLKLWQAEADRVGGTRFELVRVMYEDMGRIDLAITILLDFMNLEKEL